jgi:uncharacterized protein
MRLTQDSTSNVNVIRGYGRGELRINDAVFHDTVLVAASVKETLPSLADVADLTQEHAARLLAHDPEVVLLGTGLRQVFPAPAFGARFLEAGIGFEVMDTGAACRTYNVLVGEQRRVVALLMI